MSLEYGKPECIEGEWAGVMFCVGLEGTALGWTNQNGMSWREWIGVIFCAGLGGTGLDWTNQNGMS